MRFVRQGSLKTHFYCEYLKLESAFCATGVTQNEFSTNISKHTKCVLCDTGHSKRKKVGSGPVQGRFRAGSGPAECAGPVSYRISAEKSNNRISAY